MTLRGSSPCPHPATAPWKIVENVDVNIVRTSYIHIYLLTFLKQGCSAPWRLPDIPLLSHLLPNRKTYRRSLPHDLRVRPAPPSLAISLLHTHSLWALVALSFACAHAMALLLVTGVQFNLSSIYTLPAGMVLGRLVGTGFSRHWKIFILLSCLLLPSVGTNTSFT